MLELLKKNKEVLWYLIFGVLTTVVNIVVYYSVSQLMGIDYLPANVVAWLLSVLFAYFTNRQYVFVSQNKNVIKEMVAFFSSRLATGIFDLIMMWLLVDIISIYDVLAKIVVNILVVILNYVLSKLVVFKGVK